MSIWSVLLNTETNVYTFESGKGSGVHKTQNNSWLAKLVLASLKGLLNGVS
jgi:hypothetical protein